MSVNVDMSEERRKTFNICDMCLRNKASKDSICNRCIMFSLPPCHVDSFRKEFYFLSILDEYLVKRFGIYMIMSQSLPLTPFIPDAMFIFNEKLFIIEIDEYSHRNYKKDSSRDKRIFEKHPSAIILRINVDSYTTEAKYPAIWNKYTFYNRELEDKYIRVNTNIEELERRKDILYNLLPDVLYTYPVSTTVKLFYDQSS